MSADILFDNIIITSDEDAADEWAAKTYDLKRKQIDKESVSLLFRATCLPRNIATCSNTGIPSIQSRTDTNWR